MTLRVNRLHHPVTSLGPGSRAGIWVQGCSIGCRGCMSRDTWDPSLGAAMAPERVAAWLRSLPAEKVDGVTISGGEPFDQPRSLAATLERVRGWAEAVGRPIDVLCYSGYPFDRLRRLHAATLELVDAVITGPYREDLPTDLIWRGSENQELIPLTSLGRSRYHAYVDARPPRAPIQFSVGPDAVHWLGVPRRGDLERLEERLARADVSLGASAWRP